MYSLHHGTSVISARAQSLSELLPKLDSTTARIRTSFQLRVATSFAYGWLDQIAHVGVSPSRNP